jgi:hypothetical protein
MLCANPLPAAVEQHSVKNPPCILASQANGIDTARKRAWTPPVVITETAPIWKGTMKTIIEDLPEGHDSVSGNISHHGS